MNPGQAVRRAFMAQTTEGELPTYEDLREQFGSNAGIAAAAGLTNAKSTERKTFMRNLQRYNAGTRAAAPEQLNDLARRVGREVGTPLDIDDTVEMMRERGLVFERLIGVMDVSSENGRRRDVPSIGVFVEPDLLNASLAELMGEDDDGGPSLLDLIAKHQWSRAVPLFVQAVIVQGYGMPGSTTIGDLDELIIGIPH